MSSFVSLLLSVLLTFSSAYTSYTTDSTVLSSYIEPQEGVYRVGICQFVPHMALDAATQGFKDVLTEKLGDRVKFDEQNAGGDFNACKTIANNFVSNEYDLIMANATLSLLAASEATTTIPIIGTCVTEYGTALDIENYDGIVHGNISGTSDLTPFDKQVEILVELFPEAKKVALLYCSAEANSKFQVTEVAKYLTQKGIEAKEFAFADSNDLAAVTEAACAYADVICVPTDNTVASATFIIDSICRPARVPVIAGEEGICLGCGVATLSIDYYALGRKTGEMAYRILVEGADISQMPIEYDDAPVKMYNKEICEVLGITVPQGYTAIE